MPYSWFHNLRYSPVNDDIDMLIMLLLHRSDLFLNLLVRLPVQGVSLLLLPCLICRQLL